MKKFICIILTLCLLLPSSVLVLSTDEVTVYRNEFNEADYVYPQNLLQQIINKDWGYQEEDFQHYKSYAGVHPRMYTNQESVVAIREQIDSGEAYHDIYIRLVLQAEALLDTPMPGWPEGGIGTTNLHRPVGDNIALLAVTYLISQDEKYFYGTRPGCYGIKPAIEQACLVYPSWGVEQYNNDLVYAHIVNGFALAWDYCQDILAENPDLKELMLSTVRDRSQYLYQDRIDRANSYGLNHSMAQRFAFMVWALAAFEEMDYEEDAYNPDIWLRKSFEYLIPSCKLMAEDGVWHEGVSYTCYQLQFMIPAMEMAKKFFKTNLYSASEFYKNYKYAIIYNRLKNSKAAYMTPFNNSKDRDASVGLYSAYLHRLASEFRDSEAQFMAEDVIQINRSSVSFYDILWYDKTVDMGEDYRNYLPTTHYFDQEDTVSVRSSWDSDASWFIAKSGPPPGHHKSAPGTYSTLNRNLASGHSDADIGHFSLMSNGEWIFKDDEYDYGYNNTETDHHNVLLIDDIGQIGDYDVQFMELGALEYQTQERNPHFYNVKETEQYFYAAADVTEAYNSDETGLQYWRRHFLYLKPDVLFIIDDIETEGDRNLNLRFLPYIENLEQNGNTVTMLGGDNIVDMYSLDTDGASLSIDREDLLHTYPDTYYEKTVLNYKKYGNQWTNAVGITWRDSDGAQSPKRLEMIKDGKDYTFNTGTEIVSVNLMNNDVSVADIDSKMTYRANGAKAISPQLGSNIVTYDYFGLEPKRLSLALAHYEGEKLKRINVDTKTTSENPITGFSAEIVLDSVTKNTILKAFLWDNQLMPIDKNLKLSYAEPIKEAKITSLSIPNAKKLYELPSKSGYDPSVYQTHLNRYVFFYTEDSADSFKNVIPEISVSEGASVSPPKGTAYNLIENDGVVTVISEDGSKENTYYIKAIKATQSFSENFDLEQAGVLSEAANIPGDTATEIANNCVSETLLTGNTLSFTNNGLSSLEISETESGKSLMIYQKDLRSHRLRIPQYGQSLNYGGEGYYMAANYRIFLSGSPGESLNGCNINTGGGSAVYIEDRFKYDSNKRRYVTLYANTGGAKTKISDVYLNEWFDLDIMMRGLPKRDSKTQDMEIYYYVNGTVCEDAINAYYKDSNGETRTSIVSLYMDIVSSAGGRIYVDELSCMAGKPNAQ